MDTKEIILRGYCKCGCGEKAPLATANNKNRGLVKGEPLDYIRGHRARLNNEHEDVEGPNPSGLCWCGCGKITPVARKTNSARGSVKGKHTRFCKGHNQEAIRIGSKKRCSKCKEYKRFDEFNKDKLALDKLTSQCKVCIKSCYKYNPDYSFESKLKFKYGLTRQEYDAAFEDQNGCCAICERPLGDGIDMNRPDVDHCHVSGKVRGLLCSHCNRGLGHFMDRPELLDNAAKYLRSFFN